jgi:hypothetical protein
LHVVVHHGLLLVTALVALLVVTLVIVLLTTLIAVLTTTLVATLVTTLEAGVGTSRVGATLVEHVGASVLLLDGVHQESEQVGDLISGLVVEAGEVLSLVALPVLLVLVGLVEEITLLLHLVVVDVEGSTVDVEVGGLNLGSGIGGLEANEGEGGLVVLLAKELKGFDFTVVLEEVLKVILGGLGSEVLHVQVASLLGVLVLKGLVGEFLLTLALLESGLAVEELSVAHVLVVHGLNSLSCSLRSVLTVSTVSSTVADEGEGTDGVLVGVEGGNVTEGFESLLDISLSPLVGHVLNEDVVVHLSEITLRFGSEFNTDAGSAGLSLSKGACGGFGITEADETVSAG